ncbi:MAG: uroporphyrinogen decarboxylase family protein [Planctomycetota bacterium]|jgi:uroporphyrinogen-III decarboxylase
MVAKIHPGDEMTSRQRLLAAYRGEPVDRLPYWAKVCNDTWRTGQPDNVRNWSDLELLDYILADGIFGVPSGLRLRRPRIEAASEIADGVRTTVTRTPDGDLSEQWRQDPATRSWHPVVFPVKTHEDLKRYRWVYTDVSVEIDAEALRAASAACERIGERGVTKTAWGTSPLMHLVEHVIGPVNTHLMLADIPDEMDELIGLMHASCLPAARQVARHTPADLVCSVENTSTTLISPAQFDRYCLRHLCDYGRAVEAEGKMHELHMCGLLGVLLELIDTIPAASIEAFSSPELADTRLADGRARAPSKTLVGGTNCCVWLRPAGQIKQYIAAELADCADNRRTVLTTAGVAPPACSAETFRRIGQWIPQAPIRM